MIRTEWLPCEHDSTYPYVVQKATFGLGRRSCSSMLPTVVRLAFMLLQSFTFFGTQQDPASYPKLKPTQHMGSNLSELTGFNYGSGNDLPNLTGTLPASWAALTKLDLLILTGNSLSGSLPMEWSNMTQLSTVYLDNNRLSGSVPKSWGGLNELRRNSVLFGQT